MSLVMVGLASVDPLSLPLGLYERMREPATRLIARVPGHPVYEWLAARGVAVECPFPTVPYPVTERFEPIVDCVLGAARSGPTLYLTPGHPVFAENPSLSLYTASHAEGILDEVVLVGASGASVFETYESLVAVMARLRDPVTGCPWDREQTLSTLRRYVVEEAYEVVEAIDSGNPDKQAEELGDLLLQVVFHAQLAREAGTFDNAAIIGHVVRKLVRRHPHVFGDTSVENADEVLANWEQIKRGEKGYEDRTSILDGIPKDLPALMRALEVSKRVVKVGFEWPTIQEVLDKVEEEIAELRAELRRGDTARAGSELGDLLFTLVNVARQLKVDPELALREMTFRFSDRFRRIEAHAAERGVALADLDLSEMESIWQQAKREELASEA
jgi:MazG family protein